MTKIEKGVIAVILIIAASMVVQCTYAYKKIDEAGGMKNVIIEVGKEVKDISREINKD